MSGPRLGRLRRLDLALAAVLAVTLLATIAAPAAADAAPEITVCPSCPTRWIADAVAQAPSGSRITVQGGVYRGPLRLERPVQLVGVGEPVIDGGGQGTVVTITAPDVTLQGFTVRGSGTSLDHEDAAIAVNGPRATIADDRIEDALFGIYLRNAHASVVRGNTVSGKAALPVGFRGDPIRVWYSNGVDVEDNVARHGRDVILWFSHDGLVRNNVFEDDRYGLHLMFSNGARIEGNSLRGDSVGLYIMYSNGCTITGNTLTDNHGPSGMGLGLKGDDDALVQGNRFVSNRIGAQVDDSPHSLQSHVTFSGNVFAYNDTGIGFLPSVERNTLVGNDFIDNVEQVAILGGGQLHDITWTADGRGNYWSDYVGFDANGDGVGDLPYRSQHLFESLIDNHESLRVFLFSPAVTAIDFAAKAFPQVRPQTKLVDDAPLIRPVVPPGLAPARHMAAGTRLATGTLGLFAAIGGMAMIGTLRRRPNRRRPLTAEAEALPAKAGVPAGARPVAPVGNPLVSIAALTKRYGRSTAGDRATFAVAKGEAVALWGPNGAGKTTILRCLLGIASYDGRIAVDGLSPARDGRAVRQRIGFVPQELPTPNLTVGEMACFIADLKRASHADAQARLDLLGIGDQTDKDVADLSGGMRQRLSLALALIGDPSILLLDEPTANLDARGRADLLELLRHLKHEGMTVVFSSHRPDDVLMLADRILAINAGVIEAELTPEQFLETLESRARLLLYVDRERAPQAIEALGKLGYAAEGDGSVVSVALRGQPKGRVIGALARAGVDVEDFEMERGAWTAQS